MSLETALLQAAKAAEHLERAIHDGREGWRDCNAQLMTISGTMNELRREVRAYRDEMDLRDAASIERHEQLMTAIKKFGAHHA